MIAPANSVVPRPRKDVESEGQIPSLWEFLIGGVQKRLRRRRKLLRRCLKDFRVEEVHDMRVNTRRLLAQLELIESLLAVDVVADARRALRNELKALAKLRDLHVQLRHVETMLPKHPELTSFRRHLRRRQRRAIRSANKKLVRRKNGRRIAWFEKALATFVSANEQRKHPSSHRTYSSHIGHALHDAFARIIRLQRRAASQPGWLHRMRVALKTYRYMGEALPPELSELTAQRLRALQDHQRRTGEIHDLALLERRLEKYIARKGGSRDLHACRKIWDRRRSAREHAHIKLTPDILAHSLTSLGAVGGTAHTVPPQHRRNNCQPVRSDHAAKG
jgi:CHAD domain-containing protein